MDHALAVFNRSVGKLLALVFVGVVLTALSSSIILRIGINVDPGSVQEYTAYAGVVVFGLLTIIAAVQAFRAGPVVEVGLNGIRDRRISAQVVPWVDITNASIKPGRKHPVLFLQLNPDALGRLRSRSGRGVNTLAGGLAISMDGVDGSLEELLAAIKKAATITATGALRV